MLKATIVREGKDRYHVRIGKGPPQVGGDVELVEVLDQKPGESEEALKERALEFLRTRVP